MTTFDDFLKEEGIFDEVDQTAKTRVSEYQESRKLVLEFFKGNETKTDLWFSTKSEFFGGFSPNNLIQLGRQEKMREIIVSLLNGDL